MTYMILDGPHKPDPASLEDGLGGIVEDLHKPEVDHANPSLSLLSRKENVMC